jgi:LTXXQ motif family protein
LIWIKRSVLRMMYAGVQAFELHKGIAMFQRKTCASLVLLLGLAAVPAPAQQAGHELHHAPGMPSAAQSGEGMPATGSMSGGGMAEMSRMPMMGMTRMMMGQDGMGAMMAGHVEGRLAFLKTELKITNAQMPLWNAVANAIRANATTMSTMMSGGMIGKTQTATLPDKLALREKMMSAHLDALRKFEAAVDPLYAALDPEQKKTADQLLMGPMGMM